MTMYASLTSPMERNAFIMYCAMVTPGDHVLVGVGNPGIGKTKFTRAVARRIGVDEHHFLRWSVGQHGPEDFNGWPVPRGDGLHFEPPFAVKRINDGKPAVWLLDELGLAPRSVQGAALRLLDERYCGDERLFPSVKLIGMMNPPEHAADAQDISKPLANRAVWFQFKEPSKDDHVAFEMGQHEPTIEFPAFDGAAWSDSHGELVGIYAGYMQTKGTLIEDCASEQVIARFPLAYATPRSWTYALKLAATCRLFKDEAALLDLMVGTVGEPQALQFMAFYKTMDLIPPKALMENPALFAVNPARPDRTFAQATAVAHYCCDERPDKEAIKAWHGGWEFMQHLLAHECPKDLLLPAAQHLGTNKPKGQYNSKYNDTIKELAPMVLASGLGAASSTK